MDARRDRLPVWVTPAQADIFFARLQGRAPSKIRNYAIFRLMWDAGLRVSEVVHLETHHIRWEEGLIEIRQGKGGKDRVVPMLPTLRAALDRWMEVRHRLGIRARRVFCRIKKDERGQPLSRRHVWAVCKAIVRAAGLDPRISPHSFRHGFAMRLKSRGVSLRDIQALLGHSSIRTTAIYQHCDMTDLRRAIYTIDDQYGGSDVQEP